MGRYVCFTAWEAAFHVASGHARVARRSSCRAPHGASGPWNILTCAALIAGCHPCCTGCATRCRSAGHDRGIRTGSACGGG